jgi:hypothetical protein
MKNAILLHGHGGTPESFWLPWLAQELKKKEYKVWAPQLPNADNPNIEEQLSFVLNKGMFDEETLLVGHSSGCALILGILDSVQVKVDQAILVAGFASPLRDDDESVRQVRPFNWENIQSHIRDIIFINSDNDPWGADDIKGREMFNHLGGVSILLHGEGHMGSDKFNQPYKEFPLLLKLVG